MQTNFSILGLVLQSEKPGTSRVTVGWDCHSCYYVSHNSKYTFDRHMDPNYNIKTNESKILFKT